MMPTAATSPQAAIGLLSAAEFEEVKLGEQDAA
jgi:hypothetical protein